MNNYYIDDTYEFDSDTSGQTKKVYVKNSELYAELIKWRDSNPDVDKRVASEQLGEMLMKIATRYMTHPNYVRYPQYIKDDIISASVCGMLSSLPCYKFEYKNPFAYFTQICWSCAMDYLAKYYKFVNFKRDRLKEYIASQIEEGVNVKTGEQYIKMLNGLIPSNNDSDKVMMENQEFIDGLLSHTNMQQESVQDGSD